MKTKGRFEKNAWTDRIPYNAVIYSGLLPRDALVDFRKVGERSNFKEISLQKSSLLKALSLTAFLLRL